MGTKALQSPSDKDELHRKVCVIFAAVAAAQFVLWVSAAVPGLLSEGLPQDLTNEDFANYWIGARLAVQGYARDVFGPWDVYFAHMQLAFGDDYPWHSWSYPPHFLLLIAPLGLASYKVALCLFLAVSFAFFVIAARAFAGRLPIWAWLAVAPAVLANAADAQNGFLTAGLMLGVLAWRERFPVIAGVMLGCLTIKPQLGFLLPVLLLIEGRWRVIFSALATILLLVAVSGWFYGVSAWLGYLEHVIPYQKGVMMEGTGIFVAMMPSAFAWLRTVGLDGAAALYIHTIMVVPMLAVAIWGMVRTEDSVLRSAVAMIATFVVTPYSLRYDLGAASVVCATIVGCCSSYSLGRRNWRALTLLAVCALPAVIIPLASMGLPVAPVTLVAALFALALVPVWDERIKLKALSPASASD